MYPSLSPREGCDTSLISERSHAGFNGLVWFGLGNCLMAYQPLWALQYQKMFVEKD